MTSATELNVGQRIKLIRTSKQLSMKQFAESIDVTHPHISRVESGRAQPSALMLKAIESTYGVRREWLETGEGPMMAPVSELVRRELAKYGGDVQFQAESELTKAAVYSQLEQQVERMSKYDIFEADPRLNLIAKYLREVWLSGGEKQKFLVGVRMGRAFPDFEDFVARNTGELSAAETPATDVLTKGEPDGDQGTASEES